MLRAPSRGHGSVNSLTKNYLTRNAVYTIVPIETVVK
jgi:hypothetical protein